jgi:hypothetical protein
MAKTMPVPDLDALGDFALAAVRNARRLSLVDHGMSRTRQAAGLGRQRLRVVVPPRLPEALAVQAESPPRSAAGAAQVDVTWPETPLDAEFSLIRQKRADAGLGWLTTGPRGPARPARRHQPRRAGQPGGHPRAAPRRGGHLLRLD